MSEIDYQTALLLQHRFEQELKTDQALQKYDEKLARELQQQFQQEESIDNPQSGLVYKNQKPGLNSSKCLTDPSWELVDPTPDIHILFVAFNERFFWSKLFEVCVSWSKKMTSCAGICSYGGYGSVCSITLSEPLLKLRPRKDLVETLLHEMIHAYLFVTHNNRDRDGHGPQFHQHMFRINKEAGTNITVYHDFHDEVRLYQQHWWRCDGPCQQKKPYFGMVKRATNRAPGPNDRWWAEHTQTCGGKFVKVKEPEKISAAGKNAIKKKEIVSKNKDIREFVVTDDKNNKKEVVNNITGFKDLKGGVKGKYNSSSTIVVTKNRKTNSENTFQPTLISNGASTSTSNSNNATATNDFLNVRDHWANKFQNSAKPSTSTKVVVPDVEIIKIKRPSQEPLPSSSSKIQITEICDCPICEKRMPMDQLNSHLDNCLIETKPEETKKCPVCDVLIQASTFDLHVEKCINKIYVDVEEKLEKVVCLACNIMVNKNDLKSHLDECMKGIFNDDLDKMVNCPICMKMMMEEDIQSHLDECLRGNKGILNEFINSDFDVK